MSGLSLCRKEGKNEEIWIICDTKTKSIEEEEKSYYECGAPVGNPPYPTCCTLISGGYCQADIYLRKVEE